MAEFGSSFKVPEQYIESPDPAADFARDILTVRDRGVIRFFAGFARPDIYSDPRVVDALRCVREEKEADIRVQTGPLMVVGDDQENGLWRLFKEGVFNQFLCRTVRGSTPETRIIEGENDRYVYSSESGASDLIFFTRHYLNPDFVAAWQWQRAAFLERNAFEAHATDAKLPDPNIPLLISWKGYKRLRSVVERSKCVLQYTSNDELQRYAHAANIPLVLNGL